MPLAASSLYNSVGGRDIARYREGLSVECELNCPQNDIIILAADYDDLEEILNLQYLAYQSEALLLNDYSIPPLKETLAEIQAQYRTGVFLKAVTAGGDIVGSVRGQVRDGTLHIGKLMVHPDFQGRGVGRRLLAEIESRCPQLRCELFTSDKSERNLALYERVGYVRFSERCISPDLRFVYLEKPGRR